MSTRLPHSSRGDEMLRKWMAVVCLAVPAISNAQSSADSAAFKRAQSLVNDGNAVTGRAIVDSVIARSAPGTNAYAEGLYWRAILSATAADAEMDYRRIIVDYPLSPRIEDVLLRLAQLELARADYDGALQHLNKLTLEHPTGAARARAGYWTARVLFERNDVPRACAANADALARTSPDDTELRNQITYLNQRCVGVALATSPSPAPSTSPVTSTPVPSTPLTITPATTTVAPTASAGDSIRRVNQTAKADVPMPKSTSASQKPPMKLPASPKDGKPTIVEGGVSGSGEYSVQIAAYNVKSQAEAMATKLKKKGYEARVSGTSAPFRVRIGHYATESQASAVMRSLKAKQINGFVVKAE
ncbi:MAG: SPOR domain-containing protein [Gemmatimonadaceae bacterium]